MPKRRRVPEVLWRLYRDKAKTLANTIVSLLPRGKISPEICACKARGCLQCTADAMLFLLRPDDPLHYRKMLHRCFVVVNHQAPPLVEFFPLSMWSQEEIVVRITERLISNGRGRGRRNVLCFGYNKYEQSSPVLESLTSSAWNLLLARVGDDIMIYLLEHTSIFLPLLGRKHQQVAGPPISPELKRKSEYKEPIPPPVKKRKIDDKVDPLKKRCRVYLSSRDNCGTVGYRDRKYQSATATSKTGTWGARLQEVSDKELDCSSSHCTKKRRKRLRPSRWRRGKKIRCVNSQEASDIIKCTSVCSNENTSPMNLECDAKKLGCDVNARSISSTEKVPRPSLCPSNLSLATSLSVVRDVEKKRRAMFYNSKISFSVLSRKHVLNTLEPNSSGAESLMKDIFGNLNANAWSMASSQGSHICHIGSRCLYHSLLRSLEILIQKTQCCRHLRLLDKHCPIHSMDLKAMKHTSLMPQGNGLSENVCEQSNDLSNKKRKKRVKNDVPEIESYCLKSQVVSFIWAICRNIVPSDLLGTSSNWRILCRNIARFIGLRQYEKCSIKLFMHKLKTSGFPVFSDKRLLCCMRTSEQRDISGQSTNMFKECSTRNAAMHDMSHILCMKWISWLFSEIVIPLVQSNFYVTESQHGKQDVYYYRKPIWKKLTAKATVESPDKFIHLEEARARDIMRNKTFGFSRLRLLPKENGLRMVARLNSSSRLLPKESFSNSKFCRRDKHKSVNSALRDPHVVLKGIQLKEPEKLGSSVFDYNDVYRKLCPFLVGLKRDSGDIPHLFVVIADVSKAFDSINPDKLLQVMQDVITEDEYYLKLSSIVCSGKRSTFVNSVVSLSRDTDFTRFTTSIPFQSLHSIIIDQGESRSLTKEKLMSCLNELLKRNVLQLNKSFYLQNIGIPQGSILSSLLCSFYYGHLERSVIYPFLEETCQDGMEDLSGSHLHPDASAEGSNSMRGTTTFPSYVLQRFIDDILFISTSKKQAESFFSRLQRGFPDYNCYMNEKKFCINFEIEQKSGCSPRRMYVDEDGISFIQWSGLLINCHTLEVQADYNRYLKNNLSSTLTVTWQGKLVKSLRLKLCAFMRPKCYAILFDSNINSAAVIRLNAYQAFLLAAMKFHCYVVELSRACKLHPTSYLQIVLQSVRYMYKLIRRRMHNFYTGSDLRPVLELCKKEVTWLGLHAFTQVLKKKQSRYRELLASLTSQLSTHELTGNLSCEFKYAIDRKHSSSLWGIKY